MIVFDSIFTSYGLSKTSHTATPYAEPSDIMLMLLQVMLLSTSASKYIASAMPDDLIRMLLFEILKLLEILLTSMYCGSEMQIAYVT